MKEPQTEPHWVYRAEAESLEASGHVGRKQWYIYTMEYYSAIKKSTFE